MTVGLVGVLLVGCGADPTGSGSDAAGGDGEPSVEDAGEPEDATDPQDATDPDDASDERDAAGSSDPSAADDGPTGSQEPEQVDDDAEAVAPTGYGRPPVDPDRGRVSEQPHLYPPRSVDDPEPISGVLRADEDLDNGCLWLERDGEPHGVVWIAEPLDDDQPEEVRSYWARFEEGAPAELVASDGTVLAREGDEVELEGAPGEVEELEYWGYELGCQFGDETLAVAHPDASTAGPPDVPSFDPPGVHKVVELARVFPGTSGTGEALIEGTLRADPDRDGGCFWLERDGEELAIVWVGAYRVDDERPEELWTYWGRFYDDGSPAEVVSTEGEVLAREGDEVEFGGGGARVEDFGGYDLPCHSGDDQLRGVYP